MYTQLSSVSPFPAGLVCFPGSLTEHSVVRSEQNLLVTLSVMSVAQPINKWITQLAINVSSAVAWCTLESSSVFPANANTQRTWFGP